MLTKAQKREHVAVGTEKIKGSASLIFTDFTGTATGDIRTLKLALKAVGATYKVFKKRLLQIALKNAGVNVDTKQFNAQLGTVFAGKSVYDVAGIVAKFAKEVLKKTKKEFKVLGAYEAKEAKVIDAATFQVIAKLPPREVLLAQIAMMLTMPVKKVMVGLHGRREQLEKQTA